jgi:hypothetical protein
MFTPPYAPDCEIVRRDDGDLLVTHLDSGRWRIAHTDRRALIVGAALAIAHTWKAAGSDGDEPQPEPQPEPNPCAKGHRGPFIRSGMFRTCRTCGSTSMEP